MREDTKAFVNDCLLCSPARTGNRIPRRLSITAHVTRPGAFLHFDFSYLGCCFGIEEYVLVLKDDLSSYCWIELSAQRML